MATPRKVPGDEEIVPSRYNHLVQLETTDGRDVRILANLFVGACDVISADVYDAFNNNQATGRFSGAGLSETTLNKFLESGFLWRGPNSEKDVIQKASKSYATREDIFASLKGGQYGLVTSLFCNLDCPYCFQKDRADSLGYMTKKQADLAFLAIEKSEASVREKATEKTTPKIFITGGEPLLPGKKNQSVLSHIIDRVHEWGWLYNITTNGTELEGFLGKHSATKQCMHIQVTLDGPREVHDRRRYFRGGKPSFDRIVEGAEAALKAGWNIVLRVNLDMENVGRLAELSGAVQEFGWPDYENFYAYASPVTDHGAIRGNSEPCDEADLLEALLTEVRKSTKIREVFDIRHFRGFNYVENLLVNKAPQFPVLIRCEAIMGSFIFDPTGDIHTCLEAVGKSKLRVGRYDPVLKINDTSMKRWTKDNAISLRECHDCKIRFVCAGGCSLERQSKSFCKPCMPFLREMEISWAHFAKTQPEIFP